MNIKQKSFFILLVIFLVSPFSSLAQVATSTPVIDIRGPVATSTPQILGLQTPAVPALISQINNAKAMLADVVLNHELIAVYKNVKDKKTGKTTKVLSSYTLGDKDIALAILDPSSNNIIITKGRLNGRSMVFPDSAVDVKLTYFNGVNSRFAINNPSGGTVLALKYLISNPDSGSKAAIEKGLSPSIYVPFSQNLNTPDVITYGQGYLNNVINSVTAQLQNFPSAAIPGQSITQAVPPALIKSLVYAEHSDTTSILMGNVQGAMDQMNILLALNGNDTYKYSVSTASARGIAQFIPSTYKSLVVRHPEAGLNPDFITAMQDHVTSIKAMYLLLDDYAGAVRVKAATNFLTARVFDYGAASYNGGTTRVYRAVNQFGDNWNQDRSGQINDIQSRINNLTAQVKSLKKKVAAAKDKKTKASLQADLKVAQNELNSSTSELADVKAASLKNETVNYLAKIYKVIQYFNDQQLT